MKSIIKICGLTTKDAVIAASKAEFIGFVFFAKSPRNISPDKAAQLKQYTNSQVVAVTVNPDDDFLQEIIGKLQPDYIQLHGEETPERTKEIKEKFKTKIIKAFKISDVSDIEQAYEYQDIADILMFDAKVKSGLAGGNGVSFDWNLLAGEKFSKPYFIAGGITIENAKQAMQISGANMVDISSSLESSAGVKDPELIHKFIDNLC